MVGCCVEWEFAITERAILLKFSEYFEFNGREKCSKPTKTKKTIEYVVKQTLKDDESQVEKMKVNCNPKIPFPISAASLVLQRYVYKGKFTLNSSTFGLKIHNFKFENINSF